MKPNLFIGLNNGVELEVKNSSIDVSQLQANMMREGTIKLNSDKQSIIIRCDDITYIIEEEHNGNLEKIKRRKRRI